MEQAVQSVAKPVTLERAIGSPGWYGNFILADTLRFNCIRDSQAPVFSSVTLLESLDFCCSTLSPLASFS